MCRPSVHAVPVLLMLAFCVTLESRGPSPPGRPQYLGIRPGAFTVTPPSTATVLRFFRLLRPIRAQRADPITDLGAVLAAEGEAVMSNVTVGTQGEGTGAITQPGAHVPDPLTGFIFGGFLPTFMDHSSTDLDLAWALIKSCIMGDVAAVKEILEGIRTVDFAVRDSTGRSPLHIAAFLDQGGAKIAKAILDAPGGRYLLESYDNMGMTPLHAAAFSGNVDVMQIILTYQRSCCDEIRETDRCKKCPKNMIIFTITSPLPRSCWCCLPRKFQTLTPVLLSTVITISQ